MKENRGLFQPQGQHDDVEQWACRANHESLQRDLAKCIEHQMLCFLGPLVANGTQEGGTRSLVELTEAQSVVPEQGRLISHWFKGTRAEIEHSLGAMSADDVKQHDLIVRSEALVKLAHQGRLVDEGKTADRMNVDEVLLHQTPNIAWRRQVNCE